MSSDITPTQDDLARDLRADLSELEGRDGRDYEAWVCDNVDHAWPVAIRRALAAEAEVLRLRGEVDALEGVVRDESARADEVVQSLTDEVRRLRGGVEVTDDDGEAD